MIIHPQSKSVLLKLRDPSKVSDLFPKYKSIDYTGHNLAVPHKLEETIILNNLGINVPSPILHYYNWPGKFRPYSHQKDTASFLTLHRKAAVLNGLGSGKTASVLWAADYLKRERKIRKVLILSPLSTLDAVWMNEVFCITPHRNALVLHGTKETRLKLLQSDADIFIINHDGLKVIGEELRERTDIDLIIVDEASAFRNAKSQRYTLLKKLITPSTYLWLMTATPAPKAPTDAWALAKLVNPKTPAYFGQFQRMTMTKVTEFRWVPKPDAMATVFDTLKPAIRYATEDCIDLPPITHSVVQCGMTKEQTRVYDDMRRAMQFEDSKVGVSITAVNAAVRMLKLVQIACGAVRTDDEDQIAIIPPKDRLRVLIETLEEVPLDQKVIVFVPFRAVLDIVHKAIVEEGYTVSQIHGGVSSTLRNTIFADFQHKENPRILLAIPSAMSHGLNLTSASTVIWYSGIWNAEVYEQANGRVARPSQKNHIHIVHIMGTEIEKLMFAKLRGKVSAQADLLDLYRKII